MPPTIRDRDAGWAPPTISEPCESASNRRSLPWRRLVAMSPAAIDRMLRSTKAARYPAAKSATRPVRRCGPRLGCVRRWMRWSRRRGSSRSTWSPCGHTLKGEHAWTLTITDVFTGWTENVAIRNRAHSRVVVAIEEAAAPAALPDGRPGLRQRGEFINHALVTWCAQRAIFMTRARAHTSNDNAHVEQKNGDIVRKSAFRYRYDTAAELALLNELWGYVNLRKNFFLPTKKAQRVAHHHGRAQHPHLRQPADALCAGPRLRRAEHRAGRPARRAPRPDQSRRADPQHQPDPTSPDRLGQGQDPHPA